METKPFYVNALSRAAEFSGGPDLLAAYLGVTDELLDRWLQGTAQIPPHLFFKAVDLLANEGMYRVGRDKDESEAA